MLDAVKAAFGPSRRAPGRYSGSSRELIDALAKTHGVKPENIVLGCGSTQILRIGTHVFTAQDKALVGTIPTYEECAGYAEMMGHPVRAVALDADFKIDLDKFADAAKGAGLVFYCNPNNPTATYVGARATRDFLARVNRDSPETDDPGRRGVLRLRHRSGSRHAHPPRRREPARHRRADVLEGVRHGRPAHRLRGRPRGHDQEDGRRGTAAPGTSSLNVLAMHAAHRRDRTGPSFIADERARNKEVRDFTMKWFADRGMKPTDSQANFMFVNIGRPVKEFREACRAKGVRVARDFPPFEKTHCRISFGTMDEMQKAVTVFGEVLAKKPAAAA